MAITAVRPSGTVEPRSRTALSALRSWSVMAAVVVAAAIPWYTLRLLPVLTVGTAKVNILDALVACAVLLTLPSIRRETLRGNVAVLSVLAFLCGMVVPSIIGLSDPDSAFFAIREARALAFYALAAALAAASYDAGDFFILAGGYAFGAAGAVVAVFAHLRLGLPVPGYPDQLLKEGVSAVVYLQWMTPAVAFVIGFAGIMTVRSRLALLAWTAASFALLWYVLAAAERFVQLTAIAAVPLVLVMPLGRVANARRVLAAGAILASAVVFALGVLTHAAWIGPWAGYAALRWSRAFTDGSLSYHVREFIAGLTLVPRHPILGTGLGKVIPIAPPAGEPGPWHYLSSGYGFVIVRTGLLGSILYLWMLVTAIGSGWRVLRAGVDSDIWPLHAVGLAGMIILLIANTLQPLADIPEAVVAFSLFFGMLVAGSRQAKPGEGTSV